MTPKQYWCPVWVMTTICSNFHFFLRENLSLICLPNNNSHIIYLEQEGNKIYILMNLCLVYIAMVPHITHTTGVLLSQTLKTVWCLVIPKQYCMVLKHYDILNLGCLKNIYPHFFTLHKRFFIYLNSTCCKIISWQ